jgi:hypothetical protein
VTPDLAARLGLAAAAAAIARPKNVVRQAAAKLNQRAGRDLEDALQVQHDRYRAAGEADVDKVDPEVRPSGTRDERGRILWRMVGRGRCDFRGQVAGLGGVMFDVKRLGELEKRATVRGTYGHDPQDVGQLDSLLAHARCGGVSFLLLQAEETLWLVHGVDRLRALRRGDRLPVRTRDKATGAVDHHLPHYTRPSLAHGWDWLPLLRRALAAATPLGRPLGWRQ